jgi:hypothetical protein
MYRGSLEVNPVHSNSRPESGMNGGWGVGFRQNPSEGCIHVATPAKLPVLEGQRVGFFGWGKRTRGLGK